MLLGLSAWTGSAGAAPLGARCASEEPAHELEAGESPRSGPQRSGPPRSGPQRLGPQDADQPAVVLAARTSLALVPFGPDLGDLDLRHRSYPRVAPQIESLPGVWRGRMEGWQEDMTDADSKVQFLAMRQALEALVDCEQSYERMQPASGRQREQYEESFALAHWLDWTWRDWIDRHDLAGTWLTSWSQNPSESVATRARALELLVAARHSDAEALLIHHAHQTDGDLRPYALVGMAHWPRQALDRFLARTYSASPNDPAVYALMRHRLQEHGKLHADAAQEMTPVLVQQLVQDDWQVAGRALLLLERFEPEERFEALMAAMPTVAQGVQEGRARWRILADMAEQLREITGRSMGADPRPWLTLYQRYHAGQTPLRVDADAEPGGISQSQFFGIGQVSDHVTFVIDVSGSMEAPFGTTGRSAYDEAIEQLIEYLRVAGDQAWFQVVTFSDGAKTAVSLRRAEARTLEAVRKQLKGKRPGGGTQLGAGVRRALKVNRPGRPGRGAHASDSIIVLCDGATIEGKAWAESLVNDPEFPQGLRFHCVQIGSAPAPAMKALARQTGGRFVRR